MTARQKKFQDIVQIISGLVVPVSFTHNDSCKLYYDATTRGNKVIAIKANKFLFNYKIKDWEDIYNYLTPVQQEVVKNYSPMLFCILHEIGHYFTMIGVDYKANQVAKSQIRRISKSYEEVCANYRKIQVEVLADEWAVEWLRTHTELAKALDAQIAKLN